MSSPLVSIVIPVFNRARVLAETLESCLVQTCADIEVVAVDDGSADGSGAILEAFAARDPRVRVLRSVNMGQCVARNLGASLAKGAWLWFLDSDDLLLSGAVERMLGVAKADTPLVMCWEEGFWDRDLEKVRAAILAQVTDQPKVVGLWGYWPAQGFSFNTVIVRRELFIEAGGFHPALRACEEMNLTFRLLRRLPDLEVVANPQRLVLKRLDENSLAAQARRDATPWMLASLLRSAEAFAGDESAALGPVRRFLADQIYQSSVCAWRNGQQGWARLGLDQWRKFALAAPRLTPGYHDLLHRLLGFQAAESVLGAVRCVLGRRRSS